MDNEYNCEVCEEDIFFNQRDNKWCMRIENSNWDYRNEEYDYQDIEINFCYQCGKDYRNLMRESDE